MPDIAMCGSTACPVRSTNIHVSSKHMQRYLNEFSFRSNHRQMKNAMFDLLIARL